MEPEAATAEMKIVKRMRSFAIAEHNCRNKEIFVCILLQTIPSYKYTNTRQKNLYLQPPYFLTGIGIHEVDIIFLKNTKIKK